MLFERLVVYDDAARDAATNMAIDEALLESSSEPALRFYGWARPAVSFGYFSKVAEVAATYPTREFVRRWTGGGIVSHGEDLTYALITPAAHPLFPRGPAMIYAAVHAAIRDSLAVEGKSAALAAQAGPKISDACFANPVRHDVLIDGRKIAGAAQRRTRRGILLQGSVQLRLPKSFRQRLSHCLAPEVEWRPLPASVLSRAAELAAQKYATDTWQRRC